MMRVHLFQVIRKKTEEELISWVNKRVVEENIKVKSLKDKKLRN